MAHIFFKSAVILIAFSLLGVGIAPAGEGCSCCNKPLDSGSSCCNSKVNDQECSCWRVSPIDPWGMEDCFLGVFQGTNRVLQRVGDDFSRAQGVSQSPRYSSQGRIFWNIGSMENLLHGGTCHNLSLRC
jgi:hypothetical protein